MSVIGQRVTIMDSSDPTKKEMKGDVVLETANTLLLQTGRRRIMVEKAGTTLLVDGSKELIRGEDLAGRLEDRLRPRKR